MPHGLAAFSRSGSGGSRCAPVDAARRRSPRPTVVARRAVETGHRVVGGYRRRSSSAGSSPCPSRPGSSRRSILRGVRLGRWRAAGRGSTSGLRVARHDDQRHRGVDRPAEQGTRRDQLQPDPASDAVPVAQLADEVVERRHVRPAPGRPGPPAVGARGSHSPRRWCRPCGASARRGAAARRDRRRP